MPFEKDSLLNDHPLVAQLNNLRFAFDRVQDELNRNSFKLQNHYLEASNEHDRIQQLEQENRLLKEELAVLRSAPHPDAAPNAHPAVTQVQQLTLALRKLSDRLSLTEESLLTRTNELTSVKGEVVRARLGEEKAYQLAARIRGREEALKMKERELEWKVRTAEEKVKMSDLAVNEYANLVRALETRMGTRQSTSISRVSSSADVTMASGVATPNVAESLVEGKWGLQRLMSEFHQETENLHSALDELESQYTSLQAVHEVEKKAAEGECLAKSQAEFELEKLRIDDNTAAKMVACYMKFSQMQTDTLQKALVSLKTRHAATVDTLTSQIYNLNTQLQASQTLLDRFRTALDELGGDIMKESFGRRNEVALRIRMISREERLGEGLQRWLRRSEESLSRIPPNESGHDALAAMAQEAKILLSSLDAPLLPPSSPSYDDDDDDMRGGTPTMVSGSLARLLTMQYLVDEMRRELKYENSRVLKMQRMVVELGGDVGQEFVVEDEWVPPDGWMVAIPRGVVPRPEPGRAGEAPPSMLRQGSLDVEGDFEEGRTPVADAFVPCGGVQEESAPVVLSVPASQEVLESFDSRNASHEGGDLPNALAVVVLVTPEESSVTVLPSSDQPKALDVTTSPAPPPPERLEPDIAGEPQVDTAEEPHADTDDEPRIDTYEETHAHTAEEAHVGTYGEPHVDRGEVLINTYEEPHFDTYEEPNMGTSEAVHVGINEEAQVDIYDEQHADTPEAVPVSTDEPHVDTTEEAHVDTCQPHVDTHGEQHIDTTEAAPLSTDQERRADKDQRVPVDTTEQAHVVMYGKQHLDTAEEAPVDTSESHIDTHEEPYENEDASIFGAITPHAPAPPTSSTEESNSTLLPSEETPTGDVLDLPQPSTTGEGTITGKSNVEPSTPALDSPPSPPSAEPSSTKSVALPSHPLPHLEHRPLKPPPHPLLERLLQLKPRYDDLQRSFRDCHLSLQSLRESLVPPTVPGQTPSFLAFPSPIPREILEAVLDRLNDFVEDARVELEIQKSDEDLLAKGYETLLSIPGALSSLSPSPAASSLSLSTFQPRAAFAAAAQDGLAASQTDLERQIEDFINGSDTSIVKARDTFTRKLEDAQHDIAALKMAIHDPEYGLATATPVPSPAPADSSTPAASLYSAPRHPGGKPPDPAASSSSSSSSWTSWIRSASSPLSPPAPSPTTFGNIMTSPRLRHSSSLNGGGGGGGGLRTAATPPRDAANPTHANANGDVLAGMGLRIPMPRFSVGQAVKQEFSGGIAAPMPAGAAQRTRTVSAVYMLGLGARGGLGAAAPPGASPLSKAPMRVEEKQLGQGQRRVVGAVGPALGLGRFSGRDDGGARRGGDIDGDTDVETDVETDAETETETEDGCDTDIE